MQTNKEKITEIIKKMHYRPGDAIFTQALARQSHLCAAESIKALRDLANEGVLTECREYRCPSCGERLYTCEAGKESDENFFCDTCDDEFSVDISSREVYFRL